MMINASPSHSVAMRDAVAFSTWLADGHELGWPTIDDFAYHLTTLFPPVRPRGWLELRMIDALQEEWWPVAVAVTAALLDDPAASDIAAEAVDPVRDSWTAAARDSLAVPALARGRRAMLRRRVGGIRSARRRRPDRERNRRVPRPLRRAWAMPGRRSPRRSGGPRLHRRLTVVSKAEITEALEAARRRTLGILDPVPPADQARQVSPLMSPLVLGPRAHRPLRGAVAGPRARRRCADRRALRRHLRRVQAPAPRARHACRSSTPPVRATFDADVRKRALDVLDGIELDPGDAVARRRLRLRHGRAARAPARRDPARDAAAHGRLRASRRRWSRRRAPLADTRRLSHDVLVDGGTFTMGTSTDPWAYDNERPGARP